VIRRAMREDAEAIAQVETRAWRHAYADIIDPQFLAELDPAVRTAEWREYLERPDRTILVAEVEGRVVGYASVRDDGNLRTLYVDPPAQGAGVGTQLLAEAERTGARELEVLEANGHGRHFYEARGWRDAGPGEDTLDRPTRCYVR
jgi:ribosomal protein S18 acetylase RimI-like enzyme